jgi:hypothetical protein
VYNTNFSIVPGVGAGRVDPLDRFDLFHQWACGSDDGAARTPQATWQARSFFLSLSAWEMRFVVGVPFTDKELHWLRWFRHAGAGWPLRCIADLPTAAAKRGGGGGGGGGGGDPSAWRQAVAETAFSHVKYTLENPHGVSIQEPERFYGKAADAVALQDFHRQGVYVCLCLSVCVPRANECQCDRVLHSV